MNTEQENKDLTSNDAKPVLADGYFCGIDFGNGNSQGAFVVFKDGKLVWHTRKMWKAKIYIWWKRIWHNVTVLQEQKSSASNGFRPNVYISDDLEDLKRRYTPEQLQKMWEDACPKPSEISGKVVIIKGTPK